MLCVFFNTYSTTISKFLVSHSLLALSGSLILPCLVPNVCIYNYIFWIIYSYNLIIFVHFLVLIFLIHILFGFQNTCISLSLISSHNLHFPFCFIFTSSLLLKSVKHLQTPIHPKSDLSCSHPKEEMGVGTGHQWVAILKKLVGVHLLLQYFACVGVYGKSYFIFYM